MPDLVEVKTAKGQTILVESPPQPGVEAVSDFSVRELGHKFSDAWDQVGSLAEDARAKLVSAAGTISKVELEVGLELGAEAKWFIASASGKASLKIKVTIDIPK